MLQNTWAPALQAKEFWVAQVMITLFIINMLISKRKGRKRGERGMLWQASNLLLLEWSKEIYRS